MDDYECNQSSVKEVYDSFQGYFSERECKKALHQNKQDVAQSVQWLYEEGEKERKKRTISVSKQVLLC